MSIDVAKSICVFIINILIIIRHFSVDNIDKHKGVSVRNISTNSKINLEHAKAMHHKVFRSESELVKYAWFIGIMSAIFTSTGMAFGFYVIPVLTLIFLEVTYDKIVRSTVTLTSITFVPILSLSVLINMYTESTGFALVVAFAVAVALNVAGINEKIGDYIYRPFLNERRKRRS